MTTRNVLQGRCKGVPLLLWVLIVFSLSPFGTNSGWAGNPNPAESFIAHVASFQNPANAENFVKILEKKGLHAWSKKMNVPGKGNFHRVYVGAFKTREIAVKVLQKLKDEHVISYFAVESVRSDEIVEKGKPQPKTTEAKEVKNLPSKSELKVKEQAIPGKPEPFSPGKTPEGEHPAEKAKGAVLSPLKEKKEADSRKEILVPDPVEAIPDTPAEPDEEQDSLYDDQRGIGYLLKEQLNRPLPSVSHAIWMDPTFTAGNSKGRDAFHYLGEPEDRTLILIA